MKENIQLVSDQCETQVQPIQLADTLIGIEEVNLQEVEVICIPDICNLLHQIKNP